MVTAVSEEAKVVQRETHILEGKMRSLAESEKGNAMEGKEKSKVVEDLVSLVEREKESLVMERKWSLVEGMKRNEIGKQGHLFSITRNLN